MPYDDEGMDDMTFDELEELTATTNAVERYEKALCLRSEQSGVCEDVLRKEDARTGFYGRYMAQATEARI